MKILEVTADKNGIHFLHVNPNPMSANQKCGIIFALIGAVTVLGFFWLMTGH